MKKTVIGLCALAIVLIGVLLFYNANKSELDIDIRITAPSGEGESKYIEMLSITHGNETLSDEIYAQTAEITDAFGEYRVELASILNEPYHIEVEVSFEDGKTIIKDIGTYTNENGVLQDYEHELIFDFIVTEQVVYPE